MPDEVPDILHEADVREVIQDEIEDTVGATQAAITAASEAHALNATFSDTEVETALNTLGAKINLIITRLEVAGILTAN